MMYRRARFKAVGVFLVLGVVFGAGIYVGVERQYGAPAWAATSTPLTFTLWPNDAEPSDIPAAQLWLAWNLLQENYVVTHASNTLPTAQERLFGAIKGLTESYGDPYTVFLPPQDAQAFQEDINGSFGGVGMELGLKDTQVVVVAPLKGSPAERAGMLSGDIILAVDGKSTEGFGVDDAVRVIRGPKGTAVTLTVGREGEPRPLTIKIVRDTISIPTIKTEARGDGIFVIELYSFSANSAELFRGALREFFESGSTRMILDLRGNPGGYLEAAVQMASFFLPVGEVVVTEDYQGNHDNIVHRSVGYNVFANKKLSMAILINQGSASASEILAGALQQHGVAKLIGTRSFGKGSVQELLELGGGAELKITVARWLTPNGSSISDGGLAPDIQKDRTTEDAKAGKDPQKNAAVLWLSGQ
ncbi:S41 family peptidase [Patescibacteria group bacterium]|nr:S41 family peptidase [Patescibacteria group bacterium]